MNWQAMWSIYLLLAINAYFLIAMAMFAVKIKRHGMPVDERIDHRQSAVLGPFLMHYFLWLISPIERALISARVTPNALTAFSVVLSFGAMLALATGHFGLGGWLYIATGVADIFDGRVARATHKESMAGAFADSVLDRLAEGLIFAGLVWYYHRLDSSWISSWIMVIVLAALIASFLVSYNRARAEGLGLKGMDVGGMQRPERIFLLGVASILSPLVELAVEPSLGVLQPLLVFCLCVVAVVSSFTAVRRFLFAYQMLSRQALAPKDTKAPVPVIQTSDSSTAN